MYILAIYFLLGIGIKKHVRPTVVQCYSIYPFNILKINSLYIKIKGNEYHWVMNVDTSFQAKKIEEERIHSLLHGWMCPSADTVKWLTYSLSRSRVLFCPWLYMIKKGQGKNISE